MQSNGLRVAREDGETVRRALVEAELLRADLGILREGEFLVLPIRLIPADRALPGELVQRDFEVVPSAAPSDYRDRIEGDRTWRERLPRSFDVVGDIVLIRLPDEFEPRQREIGEALLDFVPSARIVGRDRGVHGAERRRQIERIAGSGGWRTRHRENGLELEVDVERAYFSPRLAREHARVAEEVGRAEVVYDLCCGVGPFAVTIARDGRATRVVAVDSNPAAIELLRATLKRYPFRERVEPVEGALEEFRPPPGSADRAILNLPLEGIKYASSVARLVAPRGHLHYYEIAPRSEFDRRAETIMDTLGEGSWRAVDRHVVHPYAPTADLVAFEFERRDG